ncbi:hypothetical protein M501DRAFT_737379 [Patellaria atrata CBS 101060]|uniref:RWD domain-containing protein n=1 Tax=Patellaria atrata CBS 101060 TaxID=1346257 RepID=A0A9P4SBZ3_9PEZI|nr:hypothetical protein M501DRAFT_737379 [Patellaria atrata CBS 101060]
MRDRGDGERESNKEITSAFQSPTFDKDVSIRVNEAIGAASISPSGRDVVLASRAGLYIIDLDSPYSPPKYLPHRSQWDVADVQWSPFASRDRWIISTSNQKALVWNLELSNTRAPIEFVLHGHSRAITDINFSAHHPDVLATCAVDSFVHCWDLRIPLRPAMTFADWFAGATQVKWNRQDPNIIASSHDKVLRIWDFRKGAYPLRSIEAHSTKIYGVDWNRTRSTGILTCSLDKTIKFWDYSKLEDEPERVIRTPFPVWRARHTPFGWGALAMPQRGNFDLHLYDRRLGKDMKIDAPVSPVHSFAGHTDHVKEFLWRSRGDINMGMDNRDFQLVSWSNDRQLHLHRIDAKILDKVGFEKGKEVRKKLNLTRMGARYRTFTKERVDGYISVSRDMYPKQRSELSAMLRATPDPGMQRGLLTANREHKNVDRLRDPTGMQARNQTKNTVNHIAWMAGVKIGKRESGALSKYGAKPTIKSPAHQWVWDTPESLGDEITFVGKKFKRVTFEDVDVQQRTATVSMNGPWGGDGRPVFVRITLQFPPDYPKDAAPEYKLEKTTSAISDETIAKMQTEIYSIIEMYKVRKRGCLEAIVSYLVGERGLEESYSLLSIEEGLDGEIVIPPADESSSDEEDAVGPGINGGQTHDLEMSGTDLMGSVSANANVPLPKQCGAFWAADGRLVCFFPPKPPPKPLFDLETLRNNDRMPSSRNIFEGLARLHNPSPGSKSKDISTVDGDDDGMATSDGSWTSSSSSSSDTSSDGIGGLPGRFQPPAAWRGATLRFQRTSQHSSAGYVSRTESGNVKSIISIHTPAEFLPVKKELAEEYELFGDGPAVCIHNADVAKRYGYDDLAGIWHLVKHILCKDVPLEIMPQTIRKEQILVLARRSLVHIKRKDSGLDLSFDEPESVSKPKLTGRIKWGTHPFAGRWLIPALFEFFENRADVQMLTMLACVFAEPAGNESVAKAMVRMKQPELPLSMKAPAFSLDYFPSEDVAWSLYQPEKSVPPSPLPNHRRQTSSQLWDLNRRLDTYGSVNSSNGPWGGSDTAISDPITPYSTGHTPPVALSRSSTFRTSANQSYSTSPEKFHSSKRSNSNLTSAFASLSRPFSITASSSPPTHVKSRTSEADLSTSAPTTSITWGTNTFYSSGSNTKPSGPRHISRKSIPHSQHENTTFELSDIEDDEYSADEEDILPPITSPVPADEISIKVTLKNQNQFDEEASLSSPLLEPNLEWKYRAYRNAYADQLTVWGLSVKRAEVLKYNGLISYWPDLDTPATETPPQIEIGKRDVTASWLKPNGASILAPHLHPNVMIDPDPGHRHARNKDKASGDSNPTAQYGSPRDSLRARSRSPSPKLMRKSLEVQGKDNIQAVGGREDGEGQDLLGLVSKTSKKKTATKTEKKSCTVCWLPIEGLYAVCATCGRDAHVSCHGCECGSGWHKE